MGSYNREKFKVATLYAEEYRWLESQRRSSMESLAQVLRRILQELQDLQSEIRNLRIKTTPKIFFQTTMKTRMMSRPDLPLRPRIIMKGGEISG